MPRPFAFTVAGLGVAAMVVASLYAPAQPELLQDGAACEVAPCGTIEDPDRWRTAWWLWAAGLLVLLTAVLITARPIRVRWSGALVGLLAAPVWLVAVAIVSWIVSLGTSIQGAATVAACALLAPVVGLVAGRFKARRTSA
ncbi:hypothetical protein L2K70_07640 [Nocardioides KLBMP 9356]|uniref:Integral membrane protein n=1 Tax=Nocardioides potassii TaxID=2911371 RepID=A0ABS9HAK4_9ACTN|nr:hypothetical protein [Nocardioides potassii]MCF6377474.1 hypothetical protein [Nocardioides potassii]